MDKFLKIFFNKKSKDEVDFEEAKLKNYILKYIEELQRHFDVPKNKIRKILRSVYFELSFFNSIRKIMKKKFEVIKSFYQKNIEKFEKRGKKWQKPT